MSQRDRWPNTDRERFDASEVAKRAKVSLLWLQRIETNQLYTNYQIRRLDQVACALGVELYEFYKRATEMAGPAPWLRT